MKQINPKPPTGYELWRGRSPFDGSPLVALAVMHSDNAKTGDMVQIYILRSDVAPIESVKQGLENGTCGDCPLQHKASGGFGLCYVNKMFLGRVFETWKAGKYPVLKKSDLSRFKRRAVRLGAYGDPAMIPLSVVKPILKVARGWSGYTHAWRHEFARPWKQYVMASVESAALMDAAREDGWRTFRIRRADEPLGRNERVCPASEEAGKKVQCEQCLACHGAKTSGRADVSIIVHGRNRVAEMFTKLTISGRLGTLTKCA